MRTKSLIVTLLGTTLIAGLSGAALAGDATPAQTNDKAAVEAAPSSTDARASLDAATKTETEANDSLRTAVAERDSAQVALQNAMEELNDVKVKLDQLPANNPDRPELKHTAARLQRDIETRLFADLDAAKDKVTTATQAADAARAEKLAAEQLILHPSDDGPNARVVAEPNPASLNEIAVSAGGKRSGRL
jgi:alanyl-tRNA synthetase